MRSTLLGAAATLALASGIYVRADVVTETIPLRYLDAQNVPHVLKTMRGIENLTLNFNDNSITARGSDDAIATLKADLRTRDVPVTHFRLDVKLLRCRVDAQGRRQETVVISPMITTLDGFPAEFRESGPNGSFAILLAPHENPDGTVTISVEVREMGDDGEVVRSGRDERRVQLHQTTRVTGMTDAPDRAIRRAVHRGEVETHRGAYTACYVEIKPSILPR